MSAISTYLQDTLAPTEHDQDLARETSQSLSRYLDQERDLKLKVMDTESPGELVLPAPAVRFLVELFSEMARGNAVTLMPMHAELTSQQAAELLNISRPSLIKLLDDGAIPYRRVGSHRRIPLSELLAYKKHNDAARRKTLDELTAQAQELNMGY